MYGQCVSLPKTANNKWRMELLLQLQDKVMLQGTHQKKEKAKQKKPSIIMGDPEDMEM
jgi:hypothetical protein